MFRLIIGQALILLLIMLFSCAGQNIEVRPKGEIGIGFGVGNR